MQGSPLPLARLLSQLDGPSSYSLINASKAPFSTPHHLSKHPQLNHLCLADFSRLPRARSPSLVGTSPYDEVYQVSQQVNHLLAKSPAGIITSIM